ncbi:MAG: retention module-containing protein, partial [Pseudomonadota bacterium]
MATKSIGYVVELEGSAEVRTAEGVIKILNIGDSVHEGDLLVTGLNTHIVLEFFDGQKLQVSENTELLLDETVFAGLQPYTDDRVDLLAELQSQIIEGFDLAELEAPAAGNAGNTGDALHQASIYNRDGSVGQVDTRVPPFDTAGSDDDDDRFGDDDDLVNVPQDESNPIPPGTTTPT